MTKKQEFIRWLQENYGETLFVSTIAEKAEEIFTRESYSTIISKIPITEQEFHGTDLLPSDKGRLRRQQERIEQYMKNSEWRTLKEISEATGASEHAISARLSDAVTSGRWRKEKRRMPNNVWLYRLLPKASIVSENELNLLTASLNRHCSL